MKKLVICLTILINFIILLPSGVKAEPLNPEQVFRRCYAFMTQRRVPINHALLLAVKGGTMGATDACMALLNSASIAPGSGYLINQNPETIQILETMTKEFQSWFQAWKCFPDCGAWTVDLLDSNIGLYFSKVLFTQGMNFRMLYNMTEPVDAIRDNLEPRHLYYNHHNFDMFTANKSWEYYDQANNLQEWFPANQSPDLVEAGKLIGIGPARQNLVPYIRGGVNQADYPINQIFGAGVLGSSSYLMWHAAHLGGPSNGGMVTHRRLSKNIFEKFFCRDLPVLRPGDAAAAGFYNPNASGAYDQPFRKIESCSACHATMDPLAGFFRKLRGVGVGKFHSDHLHPFFTVYAESPTSAGLDPIDPLKPANNFHLQPAFGKLYFRSYNGDLVTYSGNDLTDLGEFLGASADAHACLSAKYFKLFTGIKISLDDIGSPQYTLLNAKEIEHRNFVTDTLMPVLRDQGLQEMIKVIFNSPYFKDKFYGEGGL